MARLAEVSADGAVAVEKEDDVSVKFADGEFFLEQDKHTVGTHCPFTDGSKALWNTLDIWTDYAERNELVPEKCRYFLVTNVTFGDGLARLIGEADPSTVTKCIEQLQTAAERAPASVKTLATRVAAREKSVLEAVILKTECVDASAASAGSALRRKVASMLHLPNDIDEIDILNLLHGWISNELLTAWRAGQPGVISRSAFDRQLHRSIGQFRKFKTFGLPEHLVPFAKEEIQKHRKKRYVRQLVIVTAEADETIEAISDFVRCSTERFRLANEGELTNDDWQTFDDGLLRSWQNTFRRALRLSSYDDESQIGYKVLCDIRDVAADLGGAPAHRYFVMGTYHRFADAKTIGWHPRYKDLVD